MILNDTMMGGDTPTVAQHLKRATLPIIAAAAGLAASMDLPSPFRPDPSGTNNGKSHSSAAQRRSPYYQPTGEDRQALERAAAKRLRKQQRNLRAAA